MSEHNPGLRLQFHRKLQGLEQRDLAECLGVSSQAISNWEGNRATPRLKPHQYATLLRMLKLEPDQLAEIYATSSTSM
jgi:transcriptional regulator with XRE-family HTH domain